MCGQARHGNAAVLQGGTQARGGAVEQCGLAEALEHDGAAGAWGVRRRLRRLGHGTAVWRHGSGNVGMEIRSNPGVEIK